MVKTRKYVLLVALILVTLFAILCVYTSCSSSDLSSSYDGNGGSNSSANGSVSTYQGSALANRKIIYNAYVSIYTDNVQNTIKTIIKY